MRMMTAFATSLILASCGVHAVKRAQGSDYVRVAASEAAATAEAAAAKVEGVEKEESFASGSMGAICWAAILEAMSEVGKRCPVSETPAVRAALDRSIASLDSHFRNAGGWSDQQIAAFKKQMGEHDTPTAALCANDDAVAMHAALQKSGPVELDKTTAD